MPSILTRILLFLSSYFPLAAIIFSLTVGKQPLLAASILGTSTLGLIGMLIHLGLVRRLSPTQYTVEAFERRDEEAMSYIVTYLVPFLALPSEGVQKGVAFLIFLIVICVLYVNSNMIHINPMLNLAGYHLYEVSLTDGSTQALIARRRIRRGSTIRAVRVGEDILMEKEDERRTANRAGGTDA